MRKLRKDELVVGGGLRDSQEDKEKQQLYQYQAGIRAGSRIRRKILANGLCYHYMLTYEKVVEERKVALSDFHLFKKRLDYNLGEKVPYVAVIEVQEKRKEKYGEAVLHFHVATNRRLNTKNLQATWGHGIVRSKKHSGDLARIAGYFSKYLKKDIEKCPREKGEKRFLSSKGLKNPVDVKIYMDDAYIGREIDKATAKREFSEEENPYIQFWLQEDTSKKKPSVTSKVGSMTNPA